MDRKTLYLDHCGTTPLSPDVLTALKSPELLSLFGNPSAAHHDSGAKASRAVEDARVEIARLFEVEARNVVFTSGASEANNLVILGFWFRFRDRGCRIFYSAVEHKSVRDIAIQVGDLPKGESVEIPVTSEGRIEVETLRKLINDNPRGLPTLVAVMHTNNEVPARQPIEDIARLCEDTKTYFHCDAVQGYVRESISFKKVSYGSVVVSAHKVYGPKGLGILILGPHRTTPLVVAPYLGGEQEFGLRPGTLNTSAIVSGKIAFNAHELARTKLLQHLRECDELFIRDMKAAIPNFHLTVPDTFESPGIVNFYIDRVDAPSLLLLIPDVCLNRGASCIGAGGEKFSHVPKALGLSMEVQANVLRASFGWGSTLDDIREAVVRIAAAVKGRR